MALVLVGIEVLSCNIVTRQFMYKNTRNCHNFIFDVLNFPLLYNITRTFFSTA